MSSKRCVLWLPRGASKDDVAELIRELATLKTAAMPNPHHKLIISSQLKEK